ncbi:Carbon-nitrogen hydrolase, partial [Nowakowskiella sp. JEL0078]
MKICLVQFTPIFKSPKESRDKADHLIFEAGLSNENVDLLVLPELAFSGYTFKNRKDIEPFIEDSVDGDTIKWATNYALKLGAYVQVGFPRCSVKNKDKFYNSVCIVSPSGELVALYDKHFLYEVDETWAEEGERFKIFEIAGLKYGPGICMDINPYAFKAPYNEYEFGNFHSSLGTNFIVISMAWVSNGDMIGKPKSTPNLKTINYWADRLSPLLKYD